MGEVVLPNQVVGRLGWWCDRADRGALAAPRQQSASVVESQLPVVSVVWGVDTCRPGADRGPEMAGQRRVDTLNPLEHVTSAGADGLARALRFSAETSPTTAEASGSGQLAHKGHSFSACPFRPGWVAGDISGGNLRIQL